MGSCLGKPRSNATALNGESGEWSYSIAKQRRATSGTCLEETVNQLIRETLQVIGLFGESEPPPSMTRLHDITETASGWIQLVKSLIDIVPIQHPMAASMITLLLDDSWLPTKECVHQVGCMVANFKHDYRKVHRERNFCIILGCLAERLSPNSNALLTEDTLQYLFKNLEPASSTATATSGSSSSGGSSRTSNSKDVILFSIIALEKFAKTNENKEFIKNKFKRLSRNPLLELETYADSTTDLQDREIGFCARWCLDNYFCPEDRKYSFETVNTDHINAMLNVRDVSEYLKISPDGIEARCDEHSFESVRCTYQVDAGRWYYEVLVITSGVMQIGFATKQSRFLSQEGYGIGDDLYSLSFDGCRRLVWYDAKSMAYNLPQWKAGDILGCLLDLERHEIVFSLNGLVGEPLDMIFENVTTGFFAAGSFMSFQQCRFNFGTEPFRHPPTTTGGDDDFKTFNDCGHIADKTILPRHLYLEQLRKSSMKEDSCTICFDASASVRIDPCKHRGYCEGCARQLIDCPLCRGPIIAIVPEDSS